MKLMIASDLHGSACYCRQMLQQLEQEQADRLLLLGDLLYHGPRNHIPYEYTPDSVIEQLNAVKDRLLCVRGNCDAEVDQAVLQFPILAEHCILFLGNRMIFATHGHNCNEDNPPPLRHGDILLHGHTHVPACREHDHFLYVNPGSVSIPKGSSPSSYILLTDNRLKWKTINGTTYYSCQIPDC